MKNSGSLKKIIKRNNNDSQNLYQDIGHFNLFHLEPIPKEITKPKLPYRRRDYYKILLSIGDLKLHYADKTASIKKQALIFSNPQIPYQCEHLDRIKGGHYCIFNHHFFQGYGNLNKYEVFQPIGTHVFELTDEQTQHVDSIFQKMIIEFNSSYIHKYDVLRNYVFELLHFALKTQSSSHILHQPINASRRITTLFIELLERQFPIDENHTKIKFRSASEFAAQLNVHVNHLNRALKEHTKKTTTQIIAERILQEAKNLLSNSFMNISEIAFALGFTEATHFNNFFKKHTELSPSAFRKMK